MPRNKYTDQQLLDYSEEHLLYEFQMFDWAATNFPNEKSPLMSSLVETFTVHLRNLIDFFYVASEKTDDMLAEDFCDPASSWKPGNMPSLFKYARERANKEINHITYKRKRDQDPGKDWPVADLVPAIRDIEKQFTKIATPQRLHQKVREYVQRGEIQVVTFVNASTQSPQPSIIIPPKP